MILDERDWPVISANACFEEDLICKRALPCCRQSTVESHFADVPTVLGID